MSLRYNYQKLSLKNDYEGAVIATLIRTRSEERSSSALLYIHGYNDYFFQDHLAEWAIAAGFNFCAIDMRKYGRSILPHQQPNMFRDVSEYFEELDMAIGRLKEEGNETIVLLAHSTGGLVASIYAHERRHNSMVDLLILNSPYLENNAGFFARKIIMPVFAAIGSIAPAAFTGLKLSNSYAQSVHRDYQGEWDYDLALKPMKSFPLTFGWMRGLYRAQKKVHRGLDIRCPVLVLYSSKSVPPGAYHEGMQKADAVLNVKHIKKYALRLGKQVKRQEVADGMHDLALSARPAREAYFRALSAFLKENKL